MHPRHIVALLPFCAVLACGGADSPDPLDEVADDALFAASRTLWRTSVIPVCWENGTPADDAERGWVRAAIERTWEAQAAIHFVGWGPCAASSASGVRIRIAEGHPHVVGLGTRLAGVEHGMLLNFTFASWGTVCQSNRRYCIETIAVHEFGHVLGFAHEQNRPDTPSSCAEEPQGSDGDVMVGAWDLYSVMNYCNPAYAGDGQLSDGDVRGVRALYGPRDPNRRAFFGLPIEDYQAAFDDFVADGFFPSSVDFSSYRDAARRDHVFVSGIFSAGAPGPWVARHGMNGAEYQAAFNEHVGRGMRLVHVDTYVLDGAVRYAAVWMRRSGPSFTAYHGLSGPAHQRRFEQLVRQGFKPIVVSPANVSGRVIVAALYERASPTDIDHHIGMTLAEYHSTFADNAAAGRMLAFVTAYQEGHEPRFSAVWESTPRVRFSARHGVGIDVLHARHVVATAAGSRITHVTSYQNGDALEFAAQWAR